MKKVYLNWTKVDEAIWTLKDEIWKEFVPDIIVGVARGGLIPAVRLSHITNNTLMRVVDVKFYTDIEKRTEKPTITVPLTENITDLNVLIADDVADTGKTLVEVKKHIKSLNPKKIKVAVIAKKPQSIIDPDYYVFETDKWIIFPWEKMPVERGSGEMV
ncbi:MAG TPA: phosphoribosyltransferase family protein [Candidatus Methanofastidiosa archaeon]|nr:phosphoribosyltransferase family protein [Candidatus Methanofastidiosa archaeon]